MVVRQAAAVVSRAESRTSVGGWSPESVVSFSALSLFKSYSYILCLNINRLPSWQCFSRSDRNMICNWSDVLHIRVTAFTHAVCPTFFTLTCFVCHLRLLFSAAECMHVALLPLKCCRTQKKRRPSCDCSRAVRAWGIGGGESLRKGGRDWRTELRGKPGSHEHRSVYKLNVCGQERRRSLPEEYYWPASLAHIYNPQMLAFWLGYLLNELRDDSFFGLLFWWKDWESRWF